MDRQEALKFLRLPPDASTERVSDACQRYRERLYEQMAAAPTPEDRAVAARLLAQLETAASVLLSTSPDVKDSGEFFADLRASELGDLPLSAPSQTRADLDAGQAPPDLIAPREPAPASSPGSSGEHGLGELSQTQADDLPMLDPGMTDAGQAPPPRGGLMLAAGRVLAGRYEVRERIGEGGMGAVFRAFDRTRSEDVAIKVLLPRLMAYAKAVERFRNEAKIASSLSHPCIVRVFDIQSDGGFTFITMELLRGISLRGEIERRRQEKRRFSVDDGRSIGRQLCDALDHAHRHTVHRDIKPENVWLNADGTVKLMDFGIARLQQRSQFTATGASMGTAYYMAPEQFRGDRNVDARADQYSLAAMLYELLVGEPPLGKFEPPRRRRRDVPESLSDAIMKALAESPAGRYPDVRAMERALLRRWYFRVRPVHVALAGVGVGLLVVAAVPELRRGATGAVKIVLPFLKTPVDHAHAAAVQVRSRWQALEETIRREQVPLAAADARQAYSDAVDFRDRGNAEAAMASYTEAQEKYTNAIAIVERWSGLRDSAAAAQAAWQERQKELAQPAPRSQSADEAEARLSAARKLEETDLSAAADDYAEAERLFGVASGAAGAYRTTVTDAANARTRFEAALPEALRRLPPECDLLLSEAGRAATLEAAQQIIQSVPACFAKATESAQPALSARQDALSRREEWHRARDQVLARVAGYTSEQGDRAEGALQVADKLFIGGNYEEARTSYAAAAASYVAAAEAAGQQVDMASAAQSAREAANARRDAYQQRLSDSAGRSQARSEEPAEARAAREALGRAEAALAAQNFDTAVATFQEAAQGFAAGVARLAQQASESTAREWQAVAGQIAELRRGDAVLDEPRAAEAVRQSELADGLFAQSRFDEAADAFDGAAAGFGGAAEVGAAALEALRARGRALAAQEGWGRYGSTLPAAEWPAPAAEAGRRMQAGDASYARREWSEAREAFAEAAPLYEAATRERVAQEDEQARYADAVGRAERAYDEQRFESALDAARDALQERPDDPRASGLRDLAQARMLLAPVGRSGRVEDADETALGQAATLAEAARGACAERADAVLADVGGYRDLLESQRLASTDPQRAQELARRAQERLAGRLPSQADDWIDTLNARVAFVEARTSFERGQLDDAADALRRSLQLAPEDPESLALKRLIDYELDMRAARAALESLKAAPERDARRDALFDEARQRTESAWRAFEQQLDDPRFLDASRLLQAILLDGAADAVARGKADRARDWLAEADRLGADPARIRELRRAAERLAGPPKAIALDLGGGAVLNAVLIPAGTFTMGSPAGEPGRRPDEGPQRAVTISRPFYVGVYEVTNAQLRQALPGRRSPQFAGRSLDDDALPAAGVSRAEALRFCEWLSERSARRVRLPTEAEWEYACRAGGADAWWWGDESLTPAAANVADASLAGLLPGVPHHAHNDNHPLTAPAGSGAFVANAFGLYHTSGNLWEWCADGYRADALAGGPATDPLVAEGDRYVLRGGSFAWPLRNARSAMRWAIDADSTYPDVGLRVVVELVEED